MHRQMLIKIQIITIRHSGRKKNNVIAELNIYIIIPIVRSVSVHKQGYHTGYDTGYNYDKDKILSSFLLVL